VFSQLVGSTVAALIVGSIPLGFAVWPTHWPLVAQLALAFAATELVQYTWHRSCHANSVLWRVHAAHHSAPRLTWLSSARFHPLEVITEYILVYTPLVVLGAPPVIIVMFTVATVTCSLLQHSNVALEMGPLNWVFAGAELHRRHHAADPASQRANYGTILIVWDVVFGTRYMPRRREQQPDNIGIDGLTEQFPKNWTGHMLAPFRDQRQFYETTGQREMATARSSNHRERLARANRTKSAIRR